MADQPEAGASDSELQNHSQPALAKQDRKDAVLNAEEVIRGLALEMQRATQAVDLYTEAREQMEAGTAELRRSNEVLAAALVRLHETGERWEQTSHELTQRLDGIKRLLRIALGISAIAVLLAFVVLIIAIIR